MPPPSFETAGVECLSIGEVGNVSIIHIVLTLIIIVLNSLCISDDDGGVLAVHDVNTLVFVDGDTTDSSIDSVLGNGYCRGRRRRRQDCCC